MAIFKMLFEKLYATLTLLIMGLFCGLLMDCRDQKDPLPKICLTYATMTTLRTVIPYPKRIQKNINHVTCHLSSAGFRFFSLKIS